MRILSAVLWILGIQVIASQELLYIEASEGECVTISCEPEEKSSPLIGFYLEHTSTQPKRELVHLSENAGVKESPPVTGRVQVTGSLASPQINVTICLLRHTDIGLYTSRFIPKHSLANQVIRGSTQLFLRVKETGEDGSCQCTRYTSLLYAISVAVALLSLLLIGFCLMQITKQRQQSKPPPPASDIYEVMSVGQQGHLVVQNGTQMAAALQEDMNIYATPNLNPAQDNDYACPQALRPMMPHNQAQTVL
ncbi:uncharacterized protein LOC134469397 isoform X2 [Engraulis encrasicolus]|uniref:uncharacterized protein LOC134469397 isoform X2 n=1 Tax=Engraulis encrasicolus TaxID=184585 RepID=UPI002FD0EBB5